MRARTSPRWARSSPSWAARLDDWLKIVVKRDEALPSRPGHLEWGGVARLKRAYQGFQARGLRAAFRNVQWSELVGGDGHVSRPSPGRNSSTIPQGR